MPFINTKISVKLTNEKEQIIKEKLGKAIELIEGKTEEWLMIGFEDNYKLYFKGEELEKVAFIENEVIELKKEIMCVTSSMIHGKEVLKTFGNVKGTSRSIISSDYPTKFADNEAMYEMLIEAKILGANAIVDLNMNTPTYEISGSKWQTSQIIYTGTAIKIA